MWGIATRPNFEGLNSRPKDWGFPDDHQNRFANKHHSRKATLETEHYSILAFAQTAGNLSLCYLWFCSSMCVCLWACSFSRYKIIVHHLTRCCVTKPKRSKALGPSQIRENKIRKQRNKLERERIAAEVFRTALNDLKLSAAERDSMISHQLQVLKHGVRNIF